MRKRKRRQHRIVDEDLLQTIFAKESEWQNLRHIVDRSLDPLTEARDRLKLTEAVYMFLLKEAKHRKITVLRLD